MGWWVIENLPALEKLAFISYMHVRFVTKPRRDHDLGVVILIKHMWWHRAKIKGNAMMIAEFFCRLFGAVWPLSPFRQTGRIGRHDGTDAGIVNHGLRSASFDGSW